MNGGGPACLRFTIYLEDDEIKKIPVTFKLTKEKYNAVLDCITSDYNLLIKFNGNISS